MFAVAADCNLKLPLVVLPRDTVPVEVPVFIFVFEFTDALILAVPEIVLVPPERATVFAELPNVTVLVVVPVPMLVAAFTELLILVTPEIVFVSVFEFPKVLFPSTCKSPERVKFVPDV